MNNKNKLLLVGGIILYTIGFMSIGMIGKVSMLLGGILLSIFFIRVGEELKGKRRVIGNMLKVFGIAMVVVIIIVMSITIMI